MLRFSPCGWEYKWANGKLELHQFKIQLDWTERSYRIRCETSSRRKGRTSLPYRQRHFCLLRIEASCLPFPNSARSQQVAHRSNANEILRRDKEFRYPRLHFSESTLVERCARVERQTCYNQPENSLKLHHSAASKPINRRTWFERATETKRLLAHDAIRAFDCSTRNKQGKMRWC